MKNERKDEIIRMISENRMVKAQDIAKTFQVSMETVRRDLAELEQSNVIRRVHGGAVWNRIFHTVKLTTLKRRF